MRLSLAWSTGVFAQFSLSSIKQMDVFKALFWIGILVLLASHVPMLTGGMRTHAIVALSGTAAVFVGSKLGREFLGLA